MVGAEKGVEVAGCLQEEQRGGEKVRGAGCPQGRQQKGHRQ